MGLKSNQRIVDYVHSVCAPTAPALKGQKPKKRKKGQEAGHEAGGEDAAEANGAPEKKRARDAQASEEGADRNGGPAEDADEGPTKTAAGKRKRQKHSEGVCRPVHWVCSGAVGGSVRPPLWTK